MEGKMIERKRRAGGTGGEGLGWQVIKWEEKRWKETGL